MCTMNRKKQNPAPGKQRGNGRVALNNSTAIQRQKILTHLRSKPLTTLQARHQLDVMHPAARVMELRKHGHEIITNIRIDTTPEGHRHRVAEYILLQKRQRKAA